MEGIKEFIQKIRIEFILLGSLLMAVIAFSTNFYTLTVYGYSEGISIFDTKLGWLVFLVLLGGHVATIVFCSLDNEYSKRAKMSFQATVGLVVLTFIGSFIWVVPEGAIFGTEESFGFTISGGFGLSFYWFILYIIILGFIVFLYQKYEGDGEQSAYQWILNMTNNQSGDTEQKSSTDKYDELKKAKELLDEGILTEEEYNKEKNRILEKEKEEQE